MTSPSSFVIRLHLEARSDGGNDDLDFRYEYWITAASLREAMVKAAEQVPGHVKDRLDR